MKNKMYTLLAICVLLNSALMAQDNTTVDFLNKYYFNQIPLPNNSFNLVLSKLILGGSDDRDDYYNQEAVKRLPELLDCNAFIYFGVNPNVLLTNYSKFNDYVFVANSDYFNSKMPKIEILKNKLFTIKYNNGSEESFLFNVKQLEASDNNNQRKILQVELATEDVKSKQSDDKEGDIVWRFFAIENECYLALTHHQLNRLKLNLSAVSDGLQVKRASDQKIHFTDYFSGSYQETTTGEGIYLARNKDPFMDASRYVNPKELIFLFKLK